MTSCRALTWQRGVRWQVIGDDAPAWRVGIYAPEVSSAAEITTLERHNCPELFVLLEGRVRLVHRDDDGALVEQELSAGVPVLMVAAHAGYCPDGPFSGVALVIERCEFETLTLDATPAVAT